MAIPEYLKKKEEKSPDPHEVINQIQETHSRRLNETDQPDVDITKMQGTLEELHQDFKDAETAGVQEKKKKLMEHLEIEEED